MASKKKRKKFVSLHKKQNFGRDHDFIQLAESDDKSLAYNAWWEPGHGRFRYGHPWKQYLKIGELTHQCACQFQTLNGQLEEHPEAYDDLIGMKKMVMLEACSSISMVLGKALKELALVYQIENAKVSATYLVSLLRSNSIQDKTADDLHWKMVFVRFTAVFMDIGSLTKEIASTASFKEPNSQLPDNTCPIVQINFRHGQSN